MAADQRAGRLCRQQHPVLQYAQIPRVAHGQHAAGKACAALRPGGIGHGRGQGVLSLHPPASQDPLPARARISGKFPPGPVARIHLPGGRRAPAPGNVSDPRNKPPAAALVHPGPFQAAPADPADQAPAGLQALPCPDQSQFPSARAHPRRAAGLQHHAL